MTTHTTHAELRARMCLYASDDKVVNNFTGTAAALARIMRDSSSRPDRSQAKVDMEVVIILQRLARAVDACLPVVWPVNALPEDEHAPDGYCPGCRTPYVHGICTNGCDS